MTRAIARVSHPKYRPYKETNPKKITNRHAEGKKCQQVAKAARQTEVCCEYNSQKHIDLTNHKTLVTI